MEKNIVYKVIVIVLFLFVFVMSLLLLSETNKDTKDNFAAVYAGSIIFAGLFLAFISLWKFTLLSKDTKKIEQIKQTFEQETKTKESKKISKDKRNKHKQMVNMVSERILINTKSAEKLDKFGERILINLANEFSIVQGIFFMKNVKTGKFKSSATYAHYSNEVIREFKLGEGISGQVAKNKELLNINNVPKTYITVLSGLGAGSPNNLLILPIVYNDETIGIIEIAAFVNFPDYVNDILKKITTPIGEKMFEFYKLDD